MKVLDYAGLSRFKTKLMTIFAPISHTHNDKADLTNGKVPLSELPSSVDNVVEYATANDFPSTGESKKLYIAQNTNRVSRWNGSSYSEISSSVELGETSTTAYRGDRGKAAYDHATNAGASPYGSLGLYKIVPASNGHILQNAAVQLSDLTALGVAAESDLTGLYREFWDSTDSIQIQLLNNGKIYLVVCSGILEESVGPLMDSEYGAIILIANGDYGVIHKGSEISISVSSNIMTIETDSNISMGIIEL